MLTRARGLASIGALLAFGMLGCGSSESGLEASGAGTGAIAGSGAGGAAAGAGGKPASGGAPPSSGSPGVAGTVASGGTSGRPESAAGSGGGGGRASSGGSGGTAGAQASGGAPNSAGAMAATGGTSNGAGAPGNAGTSGDTPAGAGSLPNLTIWLAGDSTVANGNTPCPTGWGARFKQYFDERVAVTNSAVGGRSVRTWLYDVQTTMDGAGECNLQLDQSGKPVLQARWQSMLTGMKAGDYLFIQFGINDGSATCDRHVGIEAFKESYRMMAEAAKERGAHPIFVTPVSAIACSGSTPGETRGGYVTATQEAGAFASVPVIDLHAASIALYGELGFCPVPGGDVSASTSGPVGDFFCDDHTHFSTSGAERVAALIARALTTQNIALARYLK